MITPGPRPLRHAHPRRVSRGSRGLLLAASLLAAPIACSASDEGPPAHVQSGVELYATQRCALCHGADGTSAFWRPGPDLTPHLGTWSVDELAEYLRDPDSVAARIERLTPGDMPGFPHLDDETRRRLAEYVLSLGASADDD